jgi:hypothetical protein
MRRSLARILAVPAAAAGIVAGTAFAAPSAFAASSLNVTSGTVAVTVNDSYIAQLAEAGVVEYPVPLSDLSADNTNKTVTATFNATGGNGNLAVDFGAVNLAGQVVVRDKNGKSVTLSNLTLNVRGGDFQGTPAGSSTPVPLWDLHNQIASWTGTTPSPTFTDTWQAQNLVVDAAGAAYLNSALGTTAFQAGQTVGTLNATWTDSYTG